MHNIYACSSFTIIWVVDFWGKTEKNGGRGRLLLELSKEKIKILLLLEGLAEWQWDGHAVAEAAGGQ
jgi:hypothetical protein